VKILVTGHKGFIGQNIVNALGEHEVTTFEWGEQLPKIQGHDWVIHIGAISSTTEKDVEKILRQNLDFSCELLDQCITHGVNLQYSSSAGVYGLNREFKETSPVDPRSPYAWSKYLFERHVSRTNCQNIITQGFRYFNVFGPGEDHKGNQASPQHKFTKQARETGVIKLFEGSDQYLRDFVAVDYVVDVHLRFLEIKESGIWNVGTGMAQSFEEVAKEIAEAYGARIEYIPMPADVKQHYQTYTCADMTKMMDLIHEEDIC
jgi:ADP-L-glycero-D-manno-heptose 6-epimerase